MANRNDKTNPMDNPVSELRETIAAEGATIQPVEASEPPPPKEFLRNVPAKNAYEFIHNSLSAQEWGLITLKSRNCTSSSPA